MLTMGGEGTSTGVTCTTIMQSFSAICVQVEHRYYGSSLPSPLPPVASYSSGLHVDYALDDHASVLEALISRYPTPSRRPVVAFGGSYSGALSTWLRMRHPDLVDGAVASSGVVNPVLDFTGFDTDVAEALGGECLGSLRSAQAYVDSYFPGGEDVMKGYFNATNLMGTKMGDEDFMYMLADGYSMMVQYGSKGELCEALGGREGEEAAEGLRGALFEHFGEDFGQDCYYDSECLRDESNNEVRVMVGVERGCKNNNGKNILMTAFPLFF